MEVTAIVPELIVENVQRSIAFYTELLGFSLVLCAPEVGEPVWAEIKKDSCHLMFQEWQTTSARGYQHCQVALWVPQYYW